jgi:hypothetical protein
MARKRYTKRYRFPRGGRFKWKVRDFLLLVEFEREYRGQRRTKM